MKEEFNLEVKTASVRNPQGNSVLERIHLVVGNMIKTFQLYKRNYLAEKD